MFGASMDGERWCLFIFLLLILNTLMINLNTNIKMINSWFFHCNRPQRVSSLNPILYEKNLRPPKLQELLKGTHIVGHS